MHTFSSRLGFELVTLIFERLKTYAPLTLQHCAGQSIINCGSMKIGIPIYLSITNKMQHYTMIFTNINALQVSGDSSAHHQKVKTLYTASGICRDFTASYRLLAQAVRSSKI